MHLTDHKKEQYKVTSAGFLSLFSVVGFMFYGLPFFFDFWVEEFGWSRATVTSGMVLGKIVVGPLLGFAAGYVIDRYGSRRLMLFGITMAGLAVAALGLMRELWHFYLFYLFVAVGYICGGPLPVQVLVSKWFTSSRGRVMGIVYLGIGVGGMLVPQIGSWLSSHLDWRTALIYLGAIMIAVALPLAFFIREPVVDTKANKQLPDRQSLHPVLRSRSFYLLAIGSMCSIGAVAGISQNLKLFLSLDLQYTQRDAAFIISCVLGASIVGRLLMGWLADRLPKKTVMLLIYSLISLSILLLHFSSVPGMLYVFAIVFGIGLGGEYLIIPLMAAELFGLAVLGRVMGLILTLDGMAEAICPTFAGWLRDRTSDYTWGFSALVLLSVAGTVAILLLPTRKQSATDELPVTT